MARRLRAPVARILIGSAIGQGAVFGVSPLLTRIYSPEDFGALALITAVCAVLGAIITLGWERAVVLPPDGATARALVRLGWISLLGVGSALAAIAYIGRSLFSEILGSRVFEDYWWLAPVTVAAIGAYALVSSTMVRAQNYTALAFRNATQGLSQAATSVVLGLAGIVPLGLLVSVAVGRIAGLVGLGVGGRRRATNKADGTRARLWPVLRRYRRFPLVNTWSRAVNSVGLQLPTILLIALYGSLEAGLFALTVRVIAAPITIIVDAGSQYFEGSFSSRLRGGEGTLTRSVLRLVRQHLLIGILPTLAVAVLGPALYGFIFGANWAEAGGYAQIIVAAYLAQFVVVPVSRALVLLEYQTTQLVWDITRAVLTSGAVVVCAISGLEMVWCVVALTLTYLATYGVLLALILRATRKYDQTIEARTLGAT
ncbi:lipopolysaccharide biosynthesis protein [Microbacterium esteraromaticum]|nr:lipopolysaccharide biosynthesis protein [Microbacterium esteraromaticum]